MEAQWPIQEQKTIKVEETLEPVELVAIRLTVVKEFTDPAVWKSARRKWPEGVGYGTRPEQTGH